MTIMCPICMKEWDYHSETESSSCGSKLAQKYWDLTNEVEDLQLK